MTSRLGLVSLTLIGVSACAWLLWSSGVRDESTHGVIGASTRQESPSSKRADTVNATASSDAAVGNGGAPCVPPVVTDGRLAAFVNRDANLDDRLFADMRSAIPQVTAPSDVEAVVKVVMDWRDNDVVRHEAMNLLRRSEYPRVVTVLKSVANNPQDVARVRGWAVQHLGDMACEDQNLTDSIVPFLRNSMRASIEQMRMESLLALVRLKDGSVSEFLPGLLATGANISDAELENAVRCVGDSGRQQFSGRLRDLLDHRSERVRVAAIISLGTLKDGAARDRLQELAGIGSDRVRSAAKNALSMY